MSFLNICHEETQKLNSGELTEEEAIKIILGQNEEDDKNTGSNNSNNGGQGANTSSNSKDQALEQEIKKKNDEIASLIGKMYVLKAKFNSELSAVESWVNSEWRKLYDEYGEEIPSGEKVKVGKAAYSKALALEADCDSQVKQILDRVRVLLKETNQSTDRVNQIQEAYDNEKMVAKS